MYWQERRIFDEEYPPPDYYEMMRGGPRRGFGAGGAGAAANPGGPMPLILPGFYSPPMMRRPETIDDRHVMAKHTDIYPGDDALAAIQKHVSHVEKALKIVSDSLSAEKNGVNGATTTTAATTVTTSTTVITETTTVTTSTTVITETTIVTISTISVTTSTTAITAAITAIAATSTVKTSTTVKTTTKRLPSSVEKTILLVVKLQQSNRSISFQTY